MKVEVLEPWPPAPSRAFWEGFAPAAPPSHETQQLRSVFCVEEDWSRAEVQLTQQARTARAVVTGAVTSGRTGGL